jgi:PAS domain S-box-containing protein
MNSVSTKSFERLLNDDLNLQTFHNTVPAGILVISFDDGRVVFSNRYFSESLGVGGDQLLGANWESFFYDKSERERLMVEFVEDDEVKDFELRLQSQNGDVVWGLASMSIISIEEEDLLLFAFTDVGGVRANASRMSHEELDQAEELDAGNPQEFGELHLELASVLPALKVVGGCCGTDHRHVEHVSRHLHHKDRKAA